MGGRGSSSNIKVTSAEEKSMDSRFKRYDYKGYVIYNMGGGRFPVYNFNKPPSNVDMGGKNKSHAVDFTPRRLKDAKTLVDRWNRKK